MTAQGKIDLIIQDQRVAMKNGDKPRVSATRFMLAAIEKVKHSRTDPKNKEYGQQLTDIDIILAIKKEIDQHQETLSYAVGAGRQETVDTEKVLIDIMSQYVPSSLSREQIESELQHILVQHGNKFKDVMPVAAKFFKGKADGKLVSEVVKGVTVQ